jgi:hypothetical protein
MVQAPEHFQGQVFCLVAIAGQAEQDSHQARPVLLENGFEIGPIVSAEGFGFHVPNCNRQRLLRAGCSTI